MDSHPGLIDQGRPSAQNAVRSGVVADLRRIIQFVLIYIRLITFRPKAKGFRVVPAKRMMHTSGAP